MTAQLTFDDEFNSLSLWTGSSGTWATTYWWQDQNGSGASLHTNGEQEWYINSQYGPTASVKPWSAANGVMTLTAAPASAEISSLINGYKYTSGMLNTYHTFSQTYGYFEMRAELPAGQGLWPAFWLLPKDGSWPPELDIMEVLGNDPTRLYTTAHTNASGAHTFDSLGTTVADTSAGFHTYAVDWQADKITWYFDGKSVHETATPADMHKPMYVMTNLAVGGYWPGAPDGSTPFPAHMDVDYVRAWTSNPYAGGGSTATTAASAAAPALSTAGMLDGTAGADVLNGADDRWNTIRGLEGDDRITGGAQGDEIFGNAGADTLVGRANPGDWIYGGQGDDRIDTTASGGHNHVNGNLGNDTVIGGAAGDTLRGGQADDVIVGGSGADWIAGDRGHNTLSGGGGADVFYAFPGSGVSVVTDFNAAAGDRIQMAAGSGYHPHQEGADLVVDVAGGGQLILQQTHVSALPAGWIFS
jgi:serralysin